MTDAEIIKALECHNICNLTNCKECPLFPTSECSAELSGYALDLINRQKAEIERSKNRVFFKVVIDEETMRNIINEKVQEFELNIKSIKAEAIKEFASAYKDQIKNYTGMFTDEGFYVSYEAVLSAVDFVLNNKLKEVVGDAE